MFTARSAAVLFREVGLLVDGPVPWGRTVPARGRGIFVVELAAPMTTAPLELTRVGKWLEHVPGLRLDGERPTSRALAARLASFRLPDQVVLYVGAAETSIGRRVAAIDATVLGERRPHSGGHWLRALDLPGTTRVWWAATDAVQEYEDAMFGAFAEGLSPAERSARPDAEVVLPFANLRRPTGERRATGLTGSLLPEPVAAPAPAHRVILVPDGDAEGARGEPAAARPRGPRQRPASAVRAAGAPVRMSSTDQSTGGAAGANLTAAGEARLRAELDALVRVRRPEVIGRIRAAKELGDLKENADYSAAREEQSFLEGRIQSLEGRLRDAVIAVAPSAGSGADLGSVVTVEVDGEEDTYTLVGSAEADAGAGRLSVASPVGRALLGRRPGDEITVQTPRGPAIYRVVTVA